MNINNELSKLSKLFTKDTSNYRILRHVALPLYVQYRYAHVDDFNGVEIVSNGENVVTFKGDYLPEIYIKRLKREIKLLTSTLEPVQSIT